MEVKSRDVYRVILTALAMLALVSWSVVYAAGGEKGAAVDKQIKPAEQVQPLMLQDKDVVPAGSPQPEAEKVMVAGEEINWQVISAGGDIGGSSANFRLSGTLGQTAVGGGASAALRLHHGFWQAFVTGTVCDCVPGDANADGTTNVGDAVYIINYVFKSGPPPSPYAVCSGDAQADCSCNVGDAVYIITYVFKSGVPPVSCEQWQTACGPSIYK